MCDERFDEEIRDIITHPNYDKIMQKVQKLLNQENPEKVTKFQEIAVDHGNFEMLLGFDTC